MSVCYLSSREYACSVLQPMSVDCITNYCQFAVSDHTNMHVLCCSQWASIPLSVCCVISWIFMFCVAANERRLHCQFAVSDHRNIHVLCCSQWASIASLNYCQFAISDLMNIHVLCFSQWGGCLAFHSTSRASTAAYGKSAISSNKFSVQFVKKNTGDPSLPFPSHSLPSPSLRSRPLNIARGSGDHCKLPMGVWVWASAEIEFVAY